MFTFRRLQETKPDGDAILSDVSVVLPSCDVNVRLADGPGYELYFVHG